MSRSNKTRFAVLGTLTISEASGYDIKKRMERTTQHFWREGDGSIYPILKQLADEGLIVCTQANADGDKPKKIYRITDDGMKELQDWLAEEPTVYHGRDELMLKVFFGWNTDKAITIQHIERFKQQLISKLPSYRSLEQKFFSEKMTTDKTHRYLTLKAGMMHIETMITWCDEALRILNNEDQ